MAAYHLSPETSEARGSAVRTGTTLGSRVAGLLEAWARQRLNRRVLPKLDQTQLADAGISREALRVALETPFWRL